MKKLLKETMSLKPALDAHSECELEFFAIILMLLHKNAQQNAVWRQRQPSQGRFNAATY